jgi:hypothetical protein
MIFGAQKRGREMANRLRSVLISLALSLLLVGIAFWAYSRGTVDWRWELAGLADAFLGRPDPAFTIIFFGICSLLAIVVWAVIRRISHSPLGASTTTRWQWWLVFGVLTAGLALVIQAVVLWIPLVIWAVVLWMRRSPSWIGSTVRWHWWWVLLAWWIGYFAGGAVTIATEAPVNYPASVHVEFRTPLLSVADAQATCRSVVGQPGLVAQVAQVGGFLQIDLRDEMGHDRGDGRAWAAVDHNGWHSHDPASEIKPANLPERPAPYKLRAVGYPATMKADPPLSFMQVYDYQVTKVTESGLSGVAELTGVRWWDPGWNPRWWVNLTIPNDPWPPTYELTVSWTCQTPP